MQTPPRPFKKNDRPELLISKMAFGGKGIAKIPTENGEYVVFVPDTIPGQKVGARILKARTKYAEAKLLKVLKKSEEEVDSPYVPIPGAPYITLPVERQHYYKKDTSIQLFKRIGKVENVADLLDEFIPSPLHFHYRNKMEYSFSSVRWDRDSDLFVDEMALGFKKRGQWLAVEQLRGDSGLFDAEMENAIPKIKDWFEERGLKAWHPKRREGFARFLIVKKSFAQNGLRINFTSSSSQLDDFDPQEFTDFIKEMLSEKLIGLTHTINDDPGDRPVATDGQRHLLFGSEFLEEEILGLKFRISLESFFQTNPKSAEKLYQKALDYIFENRMDSDKNVVLDLFSGTGTITQLLAQRTENKEVIGVELVEEAVEDARKAAVENGFSDLKFFAADVGKFLREHPEYQNKIETVVMDPPRAGIAPKTLQKVIDLDAPRIVYISCNPATQARDTTVLMEAGYVFKKFSLVDQFPHTAHIESVVLFEKSTADGR